MGVGPCAWGVVGMMVGVGVGHGGDHGVGGPRKHSLGGKIPRAQSHPEFHPKPTQSANQAKPYKVRSENARR